MRLLVIIPAFNEFPTIMEVCEGLLKHSPPYDYLVVDDGSTDRTRPWLRTNGIPHIGMPINVGIGGAMQAGYRWALLRGYQCALQLDGDGQHPTSQIPLLVEEMERTDADLVLGSRFRTASEYRQSALRMTGTLILRTWMTIFAGASVSDPTSGFRLVNRRILERFAGDYPSDYPEVETLTDLLLNGFCVREVPVTMRKRSCGKTSIGWDRAMYYMLKVPFAMMLRHRGTQRTAA